MSDRSNFTGRWLTLSLLVPSMLSASAAWPQHAPEPTTPSAQTAELHGTVLFAGLPVPGATVTATRGTENVSVTTGSGGAYDFPSLADGDWTLSVDMLCFAPATEKVTVAAQTPEQKFELKMLSLPEILATATVAKPEAPVSALTPRTVAAQTEDGKKKPAESAQAQAPREVEEAKPSDGFLINGSSSNAATSAFSMDRAFGNTRSSKSLYNGSLAAILDNSALDATPYSITGLQTGKPAYNRFTGVATFGGPINIPHFIHRGPNLFLAYEWTREQQDQTLPGLVPTLAERLGNLSADPGAPAAVTLTPQAQALLALYPLPNLAGNSLYNYQTAVGNQTHEDALQMRLDKQVKPKDDVYGALQFGSTRESNTSLFGFVDRTDTLGLNTNVNWQHRFSQRLFQTVKYNFSRQRTLVEPFFANRVNVSGAAGITAAPPAGINVTPNGGNDQDPREWGPPTLVFSNGITSLSDGTSTFNRFRTDSGTYSIQWTRGRHNITAGGDLRRQQFNILAQQNPRGTFTFTGAATGNALADFLTGTPDTSTIAFGNPDKYLRQTAYDLFVTDDWRVQPTFTLNYGLRYEYGAPVTELKGRLVNLDILPAFANVTPVLASNPQGAFTGQSYPTSLVRPDRLGFEPRVGLSWRPIAGSTLVVRAGYGIYDDTSVYEPSALALAQQNPLSTSLDVSLSATCPLTLANGFIPCSGITADQFAVDPNFRVGYAQTYQVSAQRDLPASLVGTITYLGVKGTRGVQEYLPNTNPIGAANPNPTYPAGYIFRTSGGDSTRNAAMLQLRRRLKNGFTASAQYTFSKSIDDDSVLGGQGATAATSISVGSVATSAAAGTATIAQDWRHLSNERGLSTFDQRHLLNASIQYTSGQGLGGGSLMSGYRGALLKEWTILTSIVAGSGLPETPIYLAAVPGTGVTGSIRASVTGQSVYAVPAAYATGRHLNPLAYTAPAAGQWGSAGRDSIFGPGQFTLNSSLSRTFRVKDKLNLDARLEATNLLNHVTFTSWNTIVTPTTATTTTTPVINPTFGLPLAANPQRSLQITLRLRY